MTWDEVYREIVTQMSRFIHPRSDYFRHNIQMRNRSRDPSEHLEEILEDPPFKIAFTDSTGTRCMFCTLEAKGLSNNPSLKRTLKA